MKTFLLYKNQEFNFKRTLPANAESLVQDLELNTLFQAMALEDKFLFEVAKKMILCSEYDVSTIIYRQDILKDCLQNSSVIRDIYNIAVEAIAKKQKRYFFGVSSRYPASVLSSARNLLQLFFDMLKQLKELADLHSNVFHSSGFKRFFTMIQTELDDAYFNCVQENLHALTFPDGVLISAQIGKGNESRNYVLHKTNPKKQSWLERIFSHTPSGYTVHIHERDQAGAKALGELKDKGIFTVAKALAQSAEHIEQFFITLQTELAFYIGCLNLHEKLVSKQATTTFPTPLEATERQHSFKGLYNTCLALNIDEPVVGNDMAANEKELILITGANQGGKSTFLRSVGLAQLMMQGGMFVSAESFCANVCNSVFTHYKREEDASMKSGKLDEELHRMSGIVDAITSDSLLLFNESFAATNEKEGSEIARHIIDALVERKIKIFFVTHLYALAHDSYEKGAANALFLRAERQAAGKRTFKLIEGGPLQTSFGADLYRKIFNDTE